MAVRLKDYDKAFENLQKALELAIAADKLPERVPYTSLAVNKLVYDKYEIICSTPTLCCKELLKYLKWSVFDKGVSEYIFESKRRMKDKVIKNAAQISVCTAFFMY